MKSHIVRDVRSCARCGEDHGRLVAYEFKRKPTGYTHWSMCPTTGDPILIRMIRENIDLPDSNA